MKLMTHVPLQGSQGIELEVTLADYVALGTGLVVLVTAIVAIRQLSSLRTNQLIDVFRGFGEGLYRDRKVRGLFLDIASEKPLQLRDPKVGREREATLAQLLDIFVAIWFLVRRSRRALRAVSHTTVAYVVLKASRNEEVKAFLNGTNEEHYHLGLSNVSFEPFWLLARRLEKYEVHPPPPTLDSGGLEPAAVPGPDGL